MKEEISKLIAVVILIIWLCVLSIAVIDLKVKIDEIEQRNLEVNEYILNKIDG